MSTPLPAPTGALTGACDQTTAPARPARAAATAYLAGLTVRTLMALTALVVACTPLTAWATGRPGATDGPAGVAGLVAGFLALLGVALPVVALVVARADWSAAARHTRRQPAGQLVARWDRPRTWARPLAYAAVQLTAGGAAALTAALVAVAAVVAMACPVLVATGDTATVGPVVVRTLPAAWAAAAVAALTVTAAVLTSPRAAAWHAHLVFSLLSSPEQRLQRDLAATTLSRQRVVQAFDLERRRIERDLHDGVQPQLMAVSMTLGLALAAIPDDTPGRDDVARAQQQARAAVQDLRRFVRAIHPQVLTDHGLGAATGELVDNLALPATVTDLLTTRPAAPVESSLYYCLAELLTNAVKHAHARTVHVTLARPATATTTTVIVQDDGIGGAGLRPDGGLAGITDRVAALGGTLTLSSPAGGPTRVEITVPDLPTHPDHGANHGLQEYP
ncbi:sensor histidine kinase [Arsenicicoccus dermatophilus]|uniref:sensor histidine kinase n=1 Tax=Arsenicicoccus dermatophilus TaxID=1076331 RepID=UPI003916CE6F